MGVCGRCIDRLLSVREVMLLESSKARSKIARKTDGSKSKKKSVEKYIAISQLLREMRLREGKEVNSEKMEELIEKILALNKK